MLFTKQALAIALLQALGVIAAPVDSTPVDKHATPARAAAAAPPATFTANPNIGPGGSTFTDSAHFRVYGATGTTAANALNMLEAAYSSFVDTLAWRSSGLAYNDATDDDGP